MHEPLQVWRHKSGELVMLLGRPTEDEDLGEYLPAVRLFWPVCWEDEEEDQSPEARCELIEAGELMFWGPLAPDGFDCWVLDMAWVVHVLVEDLIEQVAVYPVECKGVIRSAWKHAWQVREYEDTPGLQYTFFGRGYRRGGNPMLDPTFVALKALDAQKIGGPFWEKVAQAGWGF